PIFALLDLAPLIRDQLGKLVGERFGLGAGDILARDKDILVERHSVSPLWLRRPGNRVQPARGWDRPAREPRTIQIGHRRARWRTPRTFGGGSDADPLWRSRVGQRLQGPAAAVASRHPASPGRCRADARRGEPPRLSRGQSDRQGADAAVRGRKGALGIRRDPVLPRAGNPVRRRRSLGPGPDAALDVLRAVQPRALYRGEPLYPSL